jgi:hypothetical protein
MLMIFDSKIFRPLIRKAGSSIKERIQKAAGGAKHAQARQIFEICPGTFFRISGICSSPRLETDQCLVDNLLLLFNSSFSP